MITVETVLRRIEKECRKNILTFGTDYDPCRRTGRGTIGEDGKPQRGRPMYGAKTEARGVVQTCEELLRDVRKWRKEHRSSNSHHSLVDQSVKKLLKTLLVRNVIRFDKSKGLYELA